MQRIRCAIASVTITPHILMNFFFFFIFTSLLLFFVGCCRFLQNKRNLFAFLFIFCFVVIFVVVSAADIVCTLLLGYKAITVWTEHKLSVYESLFFWCCKFTNKAENKKTNEKCMWLSCAFKIDIRLHVLVQYK